jgi:ankyrin repeat protein
MVELLLKAGADPNTTLPGGETALMTAARTGRMEAVNALLARGADIHAKEKKQGQTALMWAAAEGHAEVVAALVKAGADFQTRVSSGFTPLLFAVREGRLGVVKALLKAGADPNETMQPNAAAGLHLGYRGPRGGTSALALAVTNAHFEVAAHLLDAGADPNASLPGLTALHIISDVRKPGVGDNDPAPEGSGNMSSLELVKKLVAKGANVNAKMTRRIALGMTGLNTLGATPFFLAAKTADAELMRTLAALGADPVLPNADNSTPLMAAAGLGTRSPGEDAGTESEVLEAVQLALELGNDINAVDNNGETAMHGAAYKNLPLVVQFLYDRGARIEVWNQRNKHGWTPLAIATGYRFGNFKPSADTMAVFHKIMKAAGISTELGPVKGQEIYN